MSEIEFRPPEPAELPAVAGLRWLWQTETGDEVTVGREAFEAAFVLWAGQAHSHRCVVAVRGRKVVGMAWLALTTRVPTPQVLDRAVGDLQSVYLVPEERDAGIGGGLVDAVLDLAGGLGLERVTVHSSTRAIPVYLRAGFTESHRLLQRETPASRP